jgi:hypothetical protein
MLTRTLLAVHGHESRLRRQHLPEALAGLCQDCPRVGATPSPPQDRSEYDLDRLERELSEM